MTEIEGTNVTFGDGMKGVLFGEENSANVILLHELWGVNEQLRDHAKYLAAKGFRVLMLDLYHGKSSLEKSEAQKLMMGLVMQKGFNEIEAAKEYLASSGSSKVGVVGFSLGASFALSAATTMHDLSPLVVFYGTPSSRLCDLTQIRSPVQAHFGVLDTSVGFSDQAASQLLEEKLEEGKVEHEIYNYENMGHDFMNDRPEMVEAMKNAGEDFGIDQDVIALAWKRTVEFLNSHLN